MRTFSYGRLTFYNFVKGLRGDAVVLPFSRYYFYFHFLLFIFIGMFLLTVYRSTWFASIYGFYFIFVRELGRSVLVRRLTTYTGLLFSKTWERFYLLLNHRIFLPSPFIIDFFLFSWSWCTIFLELNYVFLICLGWKPPFRIRYIPIVLC